MTSHETNWVDLSVSSFDWGESTGIIKLIITIIPVLLKFAVSFSWMTSQTSRGCTTSFPYSAFPFRNTASTLCAAQLYLSAVCRCLLWWLLGFYLESHRWTCSWLKWKTIPSSCVSAEILYGQPHGFETVKSALPVQCPFQACCQWGLYAALSRFWQVSSFLLSVAPSPPPPPSYHCSVTSLLCCFLFFLSFFFLLLLVSLTVSLCFSFSLALLFFLWPMSHSSLCSSWDTQDPSQMGVLINSRRCVTHPDLEREKNKAKHSHMLPVSMCAAWKGRNPTEKCFGESIKFTESFFSCRKGFMMFFYITNQLSACPYKVVHLIKICSVTWKSLRLRY